MCMQDYRIVARATLRTASIESDANGYARLPDVSRAIWVNVMFGGSTVIIVARNPADSGEQLPFSGDMRLVNQNPGYVHRRDVGCLLNGPLWANAGAPGQIMRVQWLEMDHETYSLTLMEP